MMATEDIAAGELIGFIPRAMIMTYKEAVQNCVLVQELGLHELIDELYNFKINPDEVMLILYIL